MTGYVQGFGYNPFLGKFTAASPGTREQDERGITGYEERRPDSVALNANHLKAMGYDQYHADYYAGKVFAPKGFDIAKRLDADYIASYLQPYQNDFMEGTRPYTLGGESGSGIAKREIDAIGKESFSLELAPDAGGQSPYNFAYAQAPQVITETVERIVEVVEEPSRRSRGISGVSEDDTGMLLKGSKPGLKRKTG